MLTYRDYMVMWAVYETKELVSPHRIIHAAGQKYSAGNTVASVAPQKTKHCSMGFGANVNVNYFLNDNASY